MASNQDAAVLLKKETTYKTGVTPDRSFEFLGDESLGWDKNIVQGQGLRAGSRVARSPRRVVTTAQGGGDLPVECISKGMGYIWELCMGSGTSTLVSGSTYQQVFTLADNMPSATLQKQLPRTAADGTVTIDPYTFLGAMVASFALEFGNADIAKLTATFDAGDITTATAAATNAYPTAAANLFQFANGSISTGTFTAPTASALASAATPVANIRGGSLQVNHNLTADRYNFGGAGRKVKPTPGLREIGGSLDAEYDSTTLRDAVLNETPMSFILNFTAGALSTGVETLQVALPEIKLDNEIPKTNGTDLIRQAISFAVLDNLTAAQPIWVVTRTSDTAL